MNQRIQKLAQQAGYVDNDTPYNCPTCESFNLEKFAELIVQECVNEIEFQYGGGRELADGTHSPDWDDAIECVSAWVKRHFGIKE